MDFSIVHVYRPDSEYWKSLQDVSFPLMNALSELGYSVQMLHQKFSEQSVNIIFGLPGVPTFPTHTIPKNSIIYNFEQFVSGSKAIQPHYIEALCKHTVWDYNTRNIEILKRNFNITDIHHVPLGYVPQMECIDTEYPKDIDILFYGAINPRRQHIIDSLRKKNVNVVAIEKVFDHERNFYIARSKVVLNMHYYTPGIFEEVRAGFLLANKIPVVSECNPDTSIPEELQDSCAFAPYEEIVDTAINLLNNEGQRIEQGQRGYDCFVRREYKTLLTNATVSAVNTPTSTPLPPKRINAGSGKDFKDEYINIDIDHKWNPDILLDLSQPLCHDTLHKTQRLGKIQLPKNHFEEIIANDVLEHVSDVITTTTNFLNLLKVNGVFHFQVPYDLSYGAWQDPTHVRAFNEMSLRYFTDWAWYMGWRNHRFTIANLEYSLSDYGKKLYSQNKGSEQLLRTPRAVDYMIVTLKKVETTAEQRRTYDLKHRAFYNHNKASNIA